MQVKRPHSVLLKKSPAEKDSDDAKNYNYNVGLTLKGITREFNGYINF